MATAALTWAWRLFKTYAPAPQAAAIPKNTRFGMPGMMPSKASRPPVTPRALGCPSTWVTICWLMSCGRDTRVTKTATATDNNSAGICATRPSPMVSSA